MSVFDHITPIDPSFARWLAEKEAGYEGDLRDALNPYVGQRATPELRQEIESVIDGLRTCSLHRFTPAPNWRRTA